MEGTERDGEALDDLLVPPTKQNAEGGGKSKQSSWRRRMPLVRPPIRARGRGGRRADGDSGIERRRRTWSRGVRAGR
jgi:hypothetical protein